MPMFKFVWESHILLHIYIKKNGTLLITQPYNLIKRGHL